MFRLQSFVNVGYPQLLSLWKKGSRNGSLRLLGSLKRGLLRCALEYSKRFGPVSSLRLVGMIRGIADRITDTVGQRIWRRGMDLAHRWLSGKVAAIFSNVKRWLCEDPFLFWLGTDTLVNHRLWVMVKKNGTK